MSKENEISRDNGVKRAQVSARAVTGPATEEQTQLQNSNTASVSVTLVCNIDLALLRKQKRALCEIREGAIVSGEQEDAAEGVLNLLDFIQDSILEQGLAAEETIFPRLTQLFDSEPPSPDVAA